MPENSSAVRLKLAVEVHADRDSEQDQCANFTFGV